MGRLSLSVPWAAKKPGDEAAGGAKELRGRRTASGAICRAADRGRLDRLAAERGCFAGGMVCGGRDKAGAVASVALQ
eukprot:9090489-Lingulodinium_polyedra.AAC.1